MKVLFLIDGLLVGGAEKSLLEIVRHFDATDAVFCHIYPDSPLKPAFEAAGIRVISLNVPGRYSFRTAIREVKKVVRQEQPDLIHATLYRACIVSRFVTWKTNIPLVNSFVSESYGPVRYQGCSFMQRRKRDGLKWLDLLTSRWVDLFVANSKTIATSNARYLHLQESKVRVIYRGRSAGDFTPLTLADADSLRGSLGIDTDAAKILCIGRLWPMKRHDDIIRALPAIHSSHPDTILLFAGDGPERQRLEQLATSLGVADKVRFLGVRHDIPALLQIADVVITASEYEGLPGSVIEAMLAQRPVVLSRIPVHQEMIRDGETGLLFTLHDSDDLAKQGLRLLNAPELRQRLAGAALAEAREKYDIRKVSAQYEEVYRELLRAGVP
ncbi:MAG: glycosyltransferase [Desulfuromonadales bacterium]|nr:glycosyltransferase [Desulfuromonadales bacterium]